MKKPQVMFLFMLSSLLAANDRPLLFNPGISNEIELETMLTPEENIMFRTNLATRIQQLNQSLPSQSKDASECAKKYTISCVVSVLTDKAAAPVVGIAGVKQSFYGSSDDSTLQEALLELHRELHSKALVPGKNVNVGFKISPKSANYSTK